MPPKKALAIIPTYNEADNIFELLATIGSVPTRHRIDVLVVDSNSPDGTGAQLEARKAEFPGLKVLHQPGKMGLGKAYLDGFDFLFKECADSYDAVITMDADFSHHPRYVPAMLDALETADVAVGSRYVPGGRLENWPQSRKWLSRYGNLYARVLTGIPLNDLTSGFHCFRIAALRQVLSHEIHAEGYAFLIELKFRASSDGLKLKEIPIIFADRTKGDSKISKSVIAEASWVGWRIFFQRLLGR